jgi:chromosome partitioning protein
VAHKIAFINGKGGCGKTTGIFHVAGVLSKAGERVLVIDFDKQRNTTDTLLMNAELPKKTVLDFLTGAASAGEVMGQALFQSRGNAKPKYYGVDCMAADVGLEDEAILKTVDGERIGAELSEFITEQGYTWVLVDMPPSNMALNDICFRHIVDFVIVPFSSDIYSVSGYGDIMDTVERAREANPSLNILGVYLARHMNNCKVDSYIREQLLRFDTFIDVQIPLAADIREAIMFGRPISFYRERSHSRRAFEGLVKEMRRRIWALRN